MTPSAWPASCAPAEAAEAAGGQALVLAGQSVRQLAQAAAAAGAPALALDAFGDRDTRAAARRWQAWRGFDAGDLLDALHEAARAGAAGWIAGSGFETHLDLLAAAAQRLPLLGTPPDGWRHVRDPRLFFPLLDRLGLPHPETRWDAAPADPAGWLVKDGAACGGWHVRAAAECSARTGAREPLPSPAERDSGGEGHLRTACPRVALQPSPLPLSRRAGEGAAAARASTPDAACAQADADSAGPPFARLPERGWGEGWRHQDAAATAMAPATGGRESEDRPGRALRFWQRHLPGTPMSAVFVAAGRRALLLGVNEQLVGVAGAPFAWRGAVGPLPVPPHLAAQLDSALQQLVPACGLLGLASLDFLLQPDGAFALLELNPRPGGTLQLYAPQAPLRLHLHACRGEPLPAQPVPQPVAGLQVLYALRPLRLEARTLQRLARRTWVHDLPVRPAEVGAREPVCSLSAAGAQAGAVHALLRRRHAELLELLEDRPHELPC